MGSEMCIRDRPELEASESEEVSENSENPEGGGEELQPIEA